MSPVDCDFSISKAAAEWHARVGTTRVEPPPVCSERLFARATREFAIGPEDAEEAEELRRRRWAPERVREFLAGRRCAAQALVDAGAPSVRVGAGAHRQPVWPTGFVGSITHTPAFAFAAAGRRSELASVGVDSEPVLEEPSLAAVAALTFRGDERALALGRAEVATAVFSAKESLFKCLYPLVGTFFDYLDARVESLELHNGAGTCVLALDRDLGARFARGQTFPLRVAIAGGHVHTCLELLP